MKVLYLTFSFILFLSGTALAWKAKNNPTANKEAHDAAFCITLGSSKMDEINVLSGRSKYLDSPRYQEDCKRLVSKWYRSGLSDSDAQRLNQQHGARRVYLTHEGLWRIEFCKKQGVFGPQVCKTMPYTTPLQHPKAKLSNPKSEQECKEKFLPDAQTNIASQVYSIACKKLFTSPPKKNVCLEKKQPGKDKKTMTDFEKLMGNLYNCTHVVNPEYKKWKNDRKWYKCILHHKALKSAKSEEAAKALLTSANPC